MNGVARILALACLLALPVIADAQVNPAAPFRFAIVKTQGKEMTDQAWLHLHDGHADAQTVSLQAVLQDPKGYPAPRDLTGIELRYRVREFPVTAWLKAPYQATLNAHDPALDALKDGIHDVSVEVRGPESWLYRPLRSYLHLSRGRAVEPTVPIFSQDEEGIDSGSGVVYVNAADRRFRSYPANPSTTAWHTMPEQTDGLFQEPLQPHSDLFKAVQMWWEEPVGTMNAGLKFVRALPPKAYRNDDFRFLYEGEQNRRIPLPHAAEGYGGMKTMPYKDGGRGVGWTDSYIQGQADSTGGVAFVSVGGPLRYMKPDGELITVAGWRVKADKDPVWILKSYDAIRANMELRGVWPGGFNAADPGFHTPMDVTIDPQNERIWYVASAHDHIIAKVVVDPATWIGTVTVLAGAVGQPGYANGIGGAARFNLPTSVVLDPRTRRLYVADQDNDAIRVVTLDGTVTTLFGGPNMAKRLQAAGAKQCAPDPLVAGHLVCEDRGSNAAVSRFTVSAAQAAAGVRPDIYVPMTVRVTSTGQIALLEIRYGTVRLIDPATGETRRVGGAAGGFAKGERNWVWMDVDRWGNSGPKDAIHWASSVCNTVEGIARPVVNECNVVLPINGGPQQFLLQYAGTADVDGWGPNGTTHVPHYSWFVTVDPRGGIYLAGIGGHGITRVRKARAGDYLWPNMSTLGSYSDVNAIIVRYGRAHWAGGFQTLTPDKGAYGSASLSFINGWYGHNYLGFPDAWGVTAATTDAEIARDWRLAPDLGNRRAIYDWVRINAGLPIVSGPPAPAPPPQGAPTGRGNAAAFVSQTVPSTMTAGQTATVTVVMRNAGTTTWNETGLYRLGSQNPQDTNLWRSGRVLFDPAGSVAPGRTWAVTFEITAPKTPGEYPFQWRMVQDRAEWFGDFTPVVTVNVR